MVEAPLEQGHAADAPYDAIVFGGAISEVPDAIARQLARPGRIAAVLGAEGRVSIGELARTIVDISGKEITIEFDISHPTLIWGQAVDCSLASSLLSGWRPLVCLREGLQLCYQDIERRLDRPRGRTVLS